jgi:uncharacterized protein YyaL (SSP411 family)
MPYLLRHTLVLGLALAFAAADVSAEPPRGKPNRLARETSPYLLQHAHNPVDWYPWGEEAFAKAKKEGKLVFLSIGYSSCHWCHVMERESFSNPEVAKILNEHFVCIKVDREERPDIDHVYMTALQVMNQRGGWPLTMWLTAEGKPLVGGTYWPPDDKEIMGEKVRGLKTLLLAIQKFAKEQPKDVEEQAAKNAEMTAAELAGAVRGLALVELNRELVAEAVDGVKERFDTVHGGFGTRSTKFPMPPTLQLLQYQAARTKSKELNGIVATTLDHMARGGIYDHIGGGFHRYSTERTWTVPHFEKMLYDNAQLCEVYARAYRETKDPLYRRVLEETLGFVRRELTSPEGAFYSALDADSEGEEGKFYVWTAKEIDALLSATDARVFKHVYGVDEGPNFEKDFSILVLKKPLKDAAADLKMSEADVEKALAGAQQKLFAVRAKRPRPFLDTKVLTAWNGEMIAGMALAGQAIDDKKSIEAAARAADFLLKNLRKPDGRLLRTWGAAPGQKAEARLNAYLDDYAFFIHGLLCLHDVTGDERWLKEAVALTDVMSANHLDKKDGAFYYTSHDHKKLFARAKDQYDGAQPAGNSVAARDLVRLYEKTQNERYLKLAEKTIKALAGPLKNSPTSLTALAEALGMYLDATEKK